MGTDYAPDYACLSTGYLEETKLFPNQHTHFSMLESKSIGEDGFLLYLDSIDISVI